MRNDYCSIMPIMKVRWDTPKPRHARYREGNLTVTPGTDAFSE